LEGDEVSQSPEAVARLFYERLNADDFAGVRSICADEMREELVFNQSVADGADAVIDQARRWKQAFPDTRATVTRAHGDPDAGIVALEVTWDGTHTSTLEKGDGRQLPASNRPMTLRAVSVMEVRDGRIAVNTAYIGEWRFG
jgi:steroid delta-isomerase-like uncharacterized protein